ncbi:hypothetical protein QVM55_26640 [Pseudomonas monteilii]|uniref:hypothetical protein n=1 Tax=Pseudomonas TaxID=286 RepID=UPI0003C0869C|nr:MULTISPECIES: hypothetical protein [Pseudomonas]AGZ38109.1 hypothetical protein PVLB_26862 [Pseudomonas sp. VLB120]
MKPEATPFNSPVWLVFYSVLSTISVANVKTALDMEWWFGVGAMGFAAASFALVIVTCREIGKGLSSAQQRPSIVEDTAQAALSMPAVQALDTKLDALCKHLGVDTVS